MDESITEKGRLWVGLSIFSVTTPYYSYYSKTVRERRRSSVQELCESRGGRPGLSVLTEAVDVKQY